MKKKHVMVAPPAGRGRLMVPEYDSHGDVIPPDYQLGDVISKGRGRFKLVATGSGLGGGEGRWTVVDCFTDKEQATRPTSKELAVFGYRILNDPRPVTTFTRQELLSGEVTTFVGSYGTLYEVAKVRKETCEGPDGKALVHRWFKLRVVRGTDDEQLGKGEFRARVLAEQCFRPIRVRIDG